MIVIGGNGGGPSEGGGIVEGTVMVGTVVEVVGGTAVVVAGADGIPPMSRIRVASAATRRPMLLAARCHAFMSDERSRRT